MFDKHREHKKAVEIALDELDAFAKDYGHRFTLDTNILIVLADAKERHVLATLAACRGYHITKVNIDEILGLISGKRVKIHAISYLKDFVKVAKTRYQNVSINKVAKELNRLSVLVPRKIVDDVVVTLDDSFLNHLLKRYQELREKEDAGTLTHADLREVSREYNKEKGKILGKVEDRFLDLCEALEVADHRIDDKLYFADVKKFIRFRLKEIEEVITQGVDFHTMINNLHVLARKTYTADVRFVAETVAKGARGRSLDSDVINLFELHACREVA